MKCNHYFFLFLSLLMGWRGSAQNKWDLKKEKDGIRVYSRTNEHSKFNELKAELTVQAKLSDLAAFILDVTNYHEWSFNTKLSYVVKPVSPSELYFYTEINSPWPASNRDLVVHLHITQDPVSKIMSIREESVPGLVPPKKNIVRIPLSIENWTITPVDKATIRIEYQLQIDPGEGAPAWMVNFFSAKGPYETFSNLREQIRKAKYREAVVGFIKN